MRERLPSLKEALKPKESEIERSIRRYLDMKRIFNWPTHAGQIIPVSNGVPDIIGILPGDGRILGIEVKLPGWKPPREDSKRYKHYAEQRDFLENIRKSKGVAFFASSVDDVIKGLQYNTELPPMRFSDMLHP
jgi:hypothetical protein